MKLEIISFNIRCCNDPNGYSVAERAPRLTEITGRYNADVIGFQEYRPIWESYIAESYGDTYDMFVKYRNETVDKEASPILWRRDKFDCLKTGYFWLSDTPEQESRGWDERFNCYRMCVYVILCAKQTGEMVTVMNTHFGFGDRGQVSSAKLIHSYSQSISMLPTIIVGDFNMTPDSAGYERMTKYFRDVNAVTAKDWRATYHGYRPEAHPDEHIDYCFIDQNVNPIRQLLITDTIDGMYPSDHFGLYSELELGMI